MGDSAAAALESRVVLGGAVRDVLVEGVVMREQDGEGEEVQDGLEEGEVLGGVSVFVPRMA